MGCCDSDSVQVSKMALELKSGPILWHKKRFFGSNWRDGYSVLYNDSSFCWYKDLSRQDQEGGIVLKDAPELIAYGPYTSQVPDRPPLPERYEQKQMLAFGVRGKDIVYWFLCPNQEEVASWMAAIASTMPSPPGQPEAPATESNGASENPASQMPQLPHQMPQSPPVSQQPASAPPYAPQQPPPQYTPSPMQAASYAPRPPQGLPGQYPNTNYRPPPYQGYNNAVYPQPYPAASVPGNTTVVVQQDRPAYIGGGGVGGGGGDFAMGMLLGGAIGTAWGSRPSFGIGFGCGGGWGHGSAWSNHHSTNVNDTDVTINNYYDNDTTIVNNNMDMTNNMSIDQTQQIQQAAIQPAVPESMPMLQESTMVEDYAPVADVGYDAGYDNGCDDYVGGGFADGFGDADFGGDFGGGDFGDF